MLQLWVCLSLCLSYEKPQGAYVYFVGQTSRASCRNESLTSERAEGSPSRSNQGRHKQNRLQCQAGRDLDKSKDRDFLGLCMQHFRTVPVLWWAQIPSPPTQQTVEAEQSARRAFTTSLAAKRSMNKNRLSAPSTTHWMVLTLKWGATLIHPRSSIPSPALELKHACSSGMP